MSAFFNLSGAHLPPVFVVKAPTRLRRKSRITSNLLSLPFVAKKNGEGIAAYWNVPATGGYVGGCATGMAMATMYLKHLRTTEANHLPTLQRIISSFRQRFDDMGGNEMETLPLSQWTDEFQSVRGQGIGFFNALYEVLRQSAWARHDLDEVSESQLFTRVNAGLAFDESGYIESLTDDEVFSHEETA